MPRMPLARISPTPACASFLLAASLMAHAAESLPVAAKPFEMSPISSGGGAVDASGGASSGGMCPLNPSGNPAGGMCASDPASTPGGQPSAAVGNPINVMSGNKFQQETDMPALPGGLGLQLSRSYNSQSQARGVLGVGWRHAYEVSLLESPAHIQILQADGRRLIFPRQASGACVSVHPGDGQVEKTAHGWRWQWTGGRVLEFEPRPGDARHGRLAAIRDPAQPGMPSLSLRYGLRGELVSVRDPAGRGLHFHYGFHGAARWPEVRVDTPAGRYRYRLDGEGRLLTVQQADGAWLGYYYERQRQGGDPYNLTGRAEWQAGARVWRRTATWAYDGMDRAVLSEHAGGVERVSLRFATASVPRSGADGEFETVLTNSLGQSTRYRWQLTGQDFRLLEARGAGCASCGTVNRRYRYDARGLVLREEHLSPAGDVLEWRDFDYDRLGRMVAQRHGGADVATESLRYAYERADLPWTVTRLSHPSVLAGHEAVTRLTHDAQGRVLAVAETGFTPLGERLERVRRYTYDHAGRLLSEDGPLSNTADGRGDITRYRYDAAGRLEQLEGVGGLRLAVLARDALGNVTRLTQRNGSRREVLQLDYDARGRLSEIVRQAGDLPLRRQQLERDDAGRLISQTDAWGRRTQWRYDDAGRLQRIEAADGQSWRLAHDTENRLLSLQRWQSGGAAVIQQLAWRYQEKAGQWQQQIHDRLGLLSARVMRADGRLQWTEDALGGRETRLHDGWGRLQASQRRGEDVLPVEWRQYVPGGWRREAAGLQADVLVDDWGRKVMERLPGQGLRLFRHDAADNRIAEAAENGETYRYRYDYAGHRIAEGGPRDPEAVTTRYDGDLPVVRSHDGETRLWQYNAFGEPVREERQQHGPDGRSRLSTISWSYDAGGRVERESRDDLHLFYDYGADNRIRAIRHSEGWLAGKLADWTRNRWTPWARPVVDQVRYDAWGQVAHLRLAHGTEQDIRRDERGRITRIDTRHQNSGRYEYDALNRLRERDEGGIRERYGYDAAGRLSRVEQWQGERWTETAAYHYDDQGNRRRLTTPDARTEYRYGSDGLQWQGQAWRATGKGWPAESAPAQLSQLAGYDAAGKPWLWWQGVLEPARGVSMVALQPEQAPLWRLETAGSQPVAWRDEQGRTPLRYGYDVQGLPLWEHWRTHAGKIWQRFSDYQGSLRLSEEDVWSEGGQEDGRMRRDYVYLGQLPVAVRVESVSGSGWGEVVANRQGAPVMVLDAGGKVRWSAGYEAFGARRAGDSMGHDAWSISLRLPGQHEDPLTGFYQNGYRTYMPLAGRYLTPDPAGVRDGLNPFVYVGSDPLNAVDPWGLYQIDMHYYMTYFLGIVTGFSADQARTIALATQFVDENDWTYPMRGGVSFDEMHKLLASLGNNIFTDRLPYYHFVNIQSKLKTAMSDEYELGSFDPEQESGESDADYRKRRLTQNIGSVVQLSNLESNVVLAPTCRLKLQFFGEYMHAFEDYFSHRDQNNDPVGTNGGLGHAYWGSSPDWTYDHTGHVADGGVMPEIEWTVNAHRTKMAEQSVYDKMVEFRDLVGIKGQAVPWSEVEKIVVGFNKIEEHAGDSHKSEANLDSFSKKVTFLQDSLNKTLGLNSGYGSKGEAVKFELIGIKSGAYTSGKDGFDIQKAYENRQDSIQDAGQDKSIYKGIIWNTSYSKLRLGDPPKFEFPEEDSPL